MVKYPGSDPVQFVIDRNGNRRQLSALQKATAIARCINLWADDRQADQGEARHASRRDCVRLTGRLH